MAKASQNSAARVSVTSPISCPAWCTHQRCNGDDYVPATAGLPLRLDHSTGVSFPAIGVALAWDIIDHRPPAVSLHVNGDGVDTQADMQLHEAKALLRSLKRAIKTLEAQP